MYIRNRMTTNPYTVTPEATIAETLELMRAKQVKHLPVVKNGKLIGMITEQKLLEVSPSPATTLSIFEIRTLMEKTKIESIMSKDIETVTPDQLIEEAAVIMKEKKVGGLPVVEQEKLVGIITKSDVFSAFIEIMGLKDHGSRIAIQTQMDQPGVLAKVAEIIAGFNVSISHIALFENEIIIRVNSLNVEEIKKSLENSGFKVLSILKNR